MKNTVGNLFSKGEIALIVGVIGIFVVLIIPIPSILLDLLITVNISATLLLLLVTLHAKGPLDLSTFPSILLFLTLFRLSLNVASTRQILLQGYGGQVIASFGEFVVGGNIIVGMVVFLIIIVIQFIVITKGATRISEVAARFTLDAMPGKQMSIDADLNAGLITEDQARNRRELISKEAEFHGAMAGASKFVSGDAIAVIIIVLINIVGGIVMGMRQGMSVTDALQHYAILTVGDGLVSQIPSFIIATASAVIITKTSSSENLGKDLSGQMLSQPNAVAFAGGILAIFSIIPGLPKLPFMILAGFFGILFFLLKRSSKKLAVEEMEQRETKKNTQEPQSEEGVEKLFHVDRMGIEVGYKIVPLVDPQKNGGILERINALRRQMARDMGMIVPPIRVRDNLQLGANQYVIKIRGQDVAKGDIFPDCYLAIDSGTTTKSIEGTKTFDPAYGLPALWISGAGKEDAEASPTVIDELTPGVMPLGNVQEVLKNLLKEHVPIRDMATILETIADFVPTTKDTELLTEYVRQRLSRTICQRYQNGEGKIGVVSFDPQLEQAIANEIHKTERGNVLALEPNMAQKLIDRLIEVIKGSLTSGYEVVLLTSSNVRSHVRRLIENALPQVAVLSYKEISSGVKIDSVGIVKL